MPGNRDFLEVGATGRPFASATGQVLETAAHCSSGAPAAKRSRYAGRECDWPLMCAADVKVRQRRRPVDAAFSDQEVTAPFILADIHRRPADTTSTTDAWRSTPQTSYVASVLESSERVQDHADIDCFLHQRALHRR